MDVCWSSGPKPLRNQWEPKAVQFTGSMIFKPDIIKLENKPNS